RDLYRLRQRILPGRPGEGDVDQHPSAAPGHAVALKRGAAPRGRCRVGEGVRLLSDLGRYGLLYAGERADHRCAQEVRRTRVRAENQVLHRDRRDRAVRLWPGETLLPPTEIADLLQMLDRRLRVDRARGDVGDAALLLRVVLPAVVRFEAGQDGALRNRELRQLDGGTRRLRRQVGGVERQQREGQAAVCTRRTRRGDARNRRRRRRLSDAGRLPRPRRAGTLSRRYDAGRAGRAGGGAAGAGRVLVVIAAAAGGQ